MEDVSPLFSVVTPVRNGERFLAQAMRSVCQQSFTRWEYVVVDGLSADSSAAIAREFAARDARIRLVCEPDRGMYDAVLKGLRTTRGAVCCWLNADDMYLPWAFDVVAQFMEATRSRWVSGVPGTWDEDGRLCALAPVPWYPRALLRAGLFNGRALGFVQQESTFFSRSLLGQVPASLLERIAGSRLAGDYLLWKALAAHSQLQVVPTLLGGMRLHAGNLSRNMAKEYYAEARAAGAWAPPRCVGRAMRAAFALPKLGAAWAAMRRWQAVRGARTTAGGG